MTIAKLFCERVILETQLFYYECRLLALQLQGTTFD